MKSTKLRITKPKSRSTKKVLKSLKDKAEKLLHEYIRKRAIDFRGYFTCYTCQQVKPADQCNAGHRHHGKLDLDERNLKPQCIACNHHKSGNLGEYERHLIEDYGLEWAQRLKQDADRDVKKYTIEELTEKIEMYKELLKSL